MARHRFRAAGTVPTLGTAKVGEEVARHRHAHPTLSAKVPCEMELIGLLEERDRNLPCASNIAMFSKFCAANAASGGKSCT